MLTPAQVKNHRFELSGRGHYRADEVDEFFDEVCDSYSQMFKENGDLVRKIGLLADKVEEYRKDEDNIRAALLTAQRMADKIVKEAKESVEGKVTEAKQTAQTLVDEAREKANAMLEEAKFSAKEHAEKADRQAEEILSAARRKAQEQAEEITGSAKTRLEELNRELALRSVELKQLNENVSAFKSEITSVCGNFAALLEKLSVHVQEDLDARIEDYVKTQGSSAAVTAEPAVAVQKPEMPLAQEQVREQPKTGDASPIQQSDGVQVEIDSTVMDSFTVNPPPETEQKASETKPGGFKLNLDDLDRTADYGDLVSKTPAHDDGQLKFGDNYDIFEDEDEEDEEEQPSKPFLNFFKK